MASKYMSIPQRAFVMNQLIQAAGEQIAQYLKAHTPKLFIPEQSSRGYKPFIQQTRTYSDGPFWFWECADIQVGAHPCKTLDDFQEKRFIRLDVEGVLSREVCLALEEQAKVYATKHVTEAPRAWYERMMEGDKYEVELEFEPCMTSPRVIVSWPGRDKALERERVKVAKEFLAEREKYTEVLSAVRAAVMEQNKLLRGTAVKLALVDAEGANELLAKVLKELAGVKP